MMGVARLVPIAGALPDEGRRPDTPVACVMDGGLPSQKTVLTTLAAVIAAGPPPQLRPPSVIVIGAVAAFAAFTLSSGTRWIG